jgi:hypothetical protein
VDYAHGIIFRSSGAEIYKFNRYGLSGVSVMWPGVKNLWLRLRWIIRERPVGEIVEPNLTLEQALRDAKQELDLAEDEKKDVIEEVLKRR